MIIYHLKVNKQILVKGLQNLIFFHIDDEIIICLFNRINNRNLFFT
jgi:hypothetical protein